MPSVIFADEVDSVLDSAHELACQGKLPVWGSVLARSQTHGRGQMRRGWVSPPGNIYAALRLPREYPFDGSAGAIAVGSIFAYALREQGFFCSLKWPNDLIIELAPARYGKVGGILLEDRNNVLIAGIGINLISAPAFLRDGAALPASDLSASGRIPPNPQQLWVQLVQSAILLYKDAAFFSTFWREFANSLFIWRGEEVDIEDGDHLYSGVFLGIGDNGGALLGNCSTNGDEEEILNGSMKCHQE